MMIRSLNGCYEVIRQLSGTSRMTEFFCQEQKYKEACLLVRIPDRALAKRITLFLEEKVRGSRFLDYKESFQWEGAFYAAFTYSTEQTLAEKLSGEICTRRERAGLARGLLEQMLLRSPHPYFMRNALKPELITVSSSLEVSWNYHLEEVQTFDYCTMEAVSRNLSDVMGVLFEKELSKKLYPSLEEYLLGLGEGKMSTYLELYQEFLPVCRQLCEEKGEDLPRTFLFRLWERCKKVLSAFKKVLMVMILVGAVLYVIYCFRDTSGSKVVQQTINQIGDIEFE